MAEKQLKLDSENLNEEVEEVIRVLENDLEPPVWTNEYPLAFDFGEAHITAKWFERGLNLLKSGKLTQKQRKKLIEVFKKYIDLADHPYAPDGELKNFPFENFYVHLAKIARGEYPLELLPEELRDYAYKKWYKRKRANV